MSESDLPGFRVKYAGIEIEYSDSSTATVNREFAKVLTWLQKTVEKKLDDLELQIVQLKEDMAEIKAMRKEA